MRAITRTTGVGINTVAKLLHDAGEAADAYHHEHVRGVRGRRHVQCDEIWAFVDAKECNVRTPRRHRPKSPVVCTGIEKTTVWDTPDMRKANTSHVERRNRTVRMSVRRFTRTLRLDLAVANLRHSLSDASCRLSRLLSPGSPPPSEGRPT